MAILEYPLDNQPHYNQRYRYYALLKAYETKKIHFGEFCVGFDEIYIETEKLIKSLKNDSEKKKTLFLTPKAAGFRELITRIWWEVYEPETLDKRWSNLNLDDEEIDRRREIYVRKSLKKISDEMETYLES